MKFSKCQGKKKAWENFMCLAGNRRHESRKDKILTVFPAGIYFMLIMKETVVVLRKVVKN